MSPLAFAGDYEGDHGDHGDHGHHSDHDGDHHHGHKASCKQDNSVDNGDDNSQKALLLNLQNTNVQVPVQACNNSVLEGVLGVLAKDQRNKDKH
ncbi:MAG TPA: hypothetical protein VGH99_01635 [Pseudonocardia sp.]